MKTLLHILAFSLLTLPQSFAQYNTVYGTGAGTGGSRNTHLGYYAGRFSTGSWNTFLGFHSGYSNTSGYYNTFLGSSSGYSNTTGRDNTFVGINSGLANTSGSNNTFLGTSSGYSNTTGQENTFVGRHSGVANTSGSNNTFLGHSSGYSNTTGAYNTFVGRHSGVANTTGHENTFLGTSSGYSNTTGRYNTFFGTNSGYYNTTGSNNTLLGTSSGYSNTTGDDNTFVGINSGIANTSGSNNTFLGTSSGYSNTTGAINTFVGRHSGVANTSGAFNTFLGHSSGYNNNIGNQNTILGVEAGYRNQSGNGNVFIGHKAGYSETESDRLYIDNNDDSEPLIYGNFFNNVVSIGTKYTGTTYNLVVQGKVRATAYDVVSDERLKKDIHALQDVLAKVQQVNGVSYGFKDDINATQDQEETAKAQAEEQMHYGFLAQNIQEVFPELVTEDEGFLAVNYQGMIPVLVEAVKELSSQTLQKDQVIQTLQQELAVMKQALQQHGIISTGSESSSAIGSLLEQNIPNPFDQVTTIGYQVPAHAQQVSLLITDLQGVTVLQFDNLQKGHGQIEIPAGRLSAGTYVYTLVVDGRPLASQRMILTK